MDKNKTFTQLYQHYSPGIRKLCLGYTGDSALADDLLQDTFIAVWNNLSKFRADAKWSTWIYRIAVNTCLLNKRNNRLQLVETKKEYLDSIPEEISQQGKSVQLLYKCISLLKESDRFIIMLILEEKPYSEIAEITGITESNLRVKIHRIKKELTEIYKRHGEL